MKKISREFQYYLDHQDKLVAEFNNKHIVIIGTKVVGAFDTHQDAYHFAFKKYKPGEFFIQYCAPGPECYTIDVYTTHSLLSL